jgi:phosphonate transport system substrate-binding protein
MYVKYQPLVDYLSSRTGQPWELSVNTSYESTVADLCAGRVALAYLGPFTYLRSHAQCGATPVVKLKTGDRAAFYADILVRADSPFERLEDLSGHRIGFGDALSTSSHLVPRAMLRAAGLEPGRDFGCRYFKQHERAARAVLMGEVEACGVRDFVGEAFVHRGLRRLARSEPIPAYPLVAPPGLSAEFRETLRQVLRGFPDGLEPLRDGERWDPELAFGFALATDPDYDPVRRLTERVFGPGSLLRPAGELLCK